jgi:hypothetical protein
MKAYLWWEVYNKEEKLDERRIEWKQFKRYFKHKYISQQYYQRKFHELKNSSKEKCPLMNWKGSSYNR